MVRRASGPPIFVLPEAVCRSDLGSGPTAGMVPDAALCDDLVIALKQAFRDVGYRVVESPEDPHVANVHVAARQTPGGDVERGASAFLAVQVIIESGGEEVERAVENGEGAESDSEKSQVRTFARSIANELARSRRMKEAGLVPGI
jgi:hypothetical protein